MRKGVAARILSIAATLLVPACATVASHTVDHGIFIEDVTLISPEREGALKGVDVIIQEGRIAAVGANLRAPADARRIDGRARYLIPGLIDAHVHVGSANALDDVALDTRPELIEAYRAQLPRAYLAFGFTTLVDVDFRRQNRVWFEATPLHPRLFHCGRGVRIAGGYGALRIPPAADVRNFSHLVHEPAQALNWPGTLDPTDHTPARVVERIVESGGICVKAFVESGFGMFDWPVPRPETLDALRTETALRRLTFAIHATSVEAWRAAIAARADVIVHGLWHWPGDRLDSRPPEDVPALFEAAARAGVRVQPTLRVLHNENAIFDWSLLDDPRLAWALPAAIITYLQTEQAQAARHALAAQYEEGARSAGETVGAAALIATANARAMATVRMMAAAGVALIFGSDTPSGEGIGNPPGLNGRLELQHWAEAGIPLSRILRAVTLDNAVAFGLASELGSIEIGKRADLLLLSANPLENVTAYDSIEIVFLNGEPIARAALRPVN